MEGEYTRGLRNGIPIALGYFSVSFTFGILCAVDSLSWYQGLLISMTNLTSAGQFAGLDIMVGAGPFIEMAVTQFVINLRYALMSVSLSQKLDDKFRGIWRLILGFGITDEIFAVASSRKNKISRRYFLGLMTLPYFSWALGTFCGVIMGSVLPDFVVNSLSIAIYGMFIAIVVPEAKANRSILICVIIAVVLSCILAYVPLFSGVTSGFAVIICAVISSCAGAYFFPADDMD